MIIQNILLNFQYGVSADIYSLSIILFELFSGIDPFPGHIGQIFQAKMSDQKPVVPSVFPKDLKKLIAKGWSRNPKERPSIEEFKSALNQMLTGEEKEEAKDLVTLPVTNYPNEKELFFLEDLNSADEGCEDYEAGLLELSKVWILK